MSISLLPLMFAILVAAHVKNNGLRDLALYEDVPEKMIINPYRTFHGQPCVQNATCWLFRGTLLVIHVKLVRLLWVDFLLRFYGAGFPNVVFFSTVDPKYSSLDMAANGTRYTFLHVGDRRTPVFLTAARCHRCAHLQVLVAAASLFPNWEGYLQVEDDVFIQYWKCASWKKEVHWSRFVNIKGSVERGRSLAASLASLTQQFPDVAHRLSKLRSPQPQKPTMLYIPNRSIPRFVLLFHVLHPFNEVGAAFVIYLMGDGVTFSGRLLRGDDRIHERRLFMMPGYLFYAPVPASGETVARMVVVLNTRQVSAEFEVGKVDFYERHCFSCASYPFAKRQTFGFYHSCRIVYDDSRCAPQVRSGFATISGRVRVDPERDGVMCPFQTAFEVEDSSAMTLRYLFHSHLPLLNTTVQKSPLLEPFPQCCVEENLDK